MSKFWIEDLRDNNGTRYWVLFTHGMFHAPTAVIDDQTMKNIAERILSIQGKITPENLGATIKQYRHRNKMTQADFSDRVGIIRTYISQIERGIATNISLDVYNKILASF